MKCPDCSTTMRVRDREKSGRHGKILSWECPQCGHIEVNTPEAHLMRRETAPARPKATVKTS